MSRTMSNIRTFCWLNCVVVAAWAANANPAIASPYSDAVLADNPVAYYRLNETSGTTAANLGSGSGIDGTYVNIPGATMNNTSNFGQAGPQSPALPGFESDNNSVFFDPEDGSVGTDTTFPRVEVGVDDSGTSPLAITGALTLEAWIMRGEDSINPGNNEGIVSRYRQDQNGAARSYNLYFDSTTDGSVGTPDGTPGLGFALSSSGSFQSANSAEFAADIPVGQWTHVAAVFEPGVQMTAYVNGVPVGSVTTNVLNDPLYSGEGDLWVGQQFNGANEWTFEGNIDEVAIYNAALSDAAILAHYQAAVVPEPASYILMILGVGAFAVARGRSNP